jgi:2-octaprenyl-6-methoxyphenol hydroxylase
LPHAAPLAKIRIVDDTQRLLRSPEVVFAATEIGLDAFGHNIENRHLLAALESRAAELKLRRIASVAQAVMSDDEGVAIKFADGEVRVRLAIGADGQRSICRGGRHRLAAADLSADRTHAQSWACAAAWRHVD